MKFRLRDYVLHPLAIKRRHDELLDSEYWAPERRRAWVQERLDRTLRQAVKNVPYYRRTLGPHESRFNAMIDELDLSELPILTRNDVRAHFDELYAEGITDLEGKTVRTSGTTGTPTRFVMDQESNLNQFAAMWRVLNWVGYRFGDRFADFKADPERRFPASYDARQNCLVFPVEHIKRDNVGVYVRALRTFRPVLIKTFPTSLNLVCHWMKELGLEGLEVRRVLCCAETLRDHHRATIEKILRCPVYDFYGQNERAAVISTCDRGRYHVHEEYSFVEFPDRRADRSEPGQSVEVVTTTFHNMAMPLIRYQTGDLVTLDDGAPCSCGRTYRTVEKIDGRLQDMVVAPDGRYLSSFEHAFYDAPGVQMSQIVQETTAGIEVKIVPAEDFAAAHLDPLEVRLRSMIGDEMRIEFSVVDSIPPGENGKIPFIISKPGSQAAEDDPAQPSRAR